MAKPFLLHSTLKAIEVPILRKHLTLSLRKNRHREHVFKIDPVGAHDSPKPEMLDPGIKRNHD